MYNQLSILTLIAEGEALKQQGLERAVEHAGTDWKESTWSLFNEWLNRMPRGFKFRTEEFRLHVTAKGIADPPSLRAFGFIAVRASREGLIKKKQVTHK